MILSDANEVYIHEILEGYGLSQYVDRVITNKGYWEECDGKFVLRIQPYHCNRTCKLCPRNLCKGEVLTTLIDEGWSQGGAILYVGDGGGDFCPVTRMREVCGI